MSRVGFLGEYVYICIMVGSISSESPLTHRFAYTYISSTKRLHQCHVLSGILVLDRMCNVVNVSSLLLLRVLARA